MQHSCVFSFVLCLSINPFSKLDILLSRHIIKYIFIFASASKTLRSKEVRVNRFRSKYLYKELPKFSSQNGIALKLDHAIVHRPTDT